MLDVILQQIPRNTFTERSANLIGDQDDGDSVTTLRAPSSSQDCVLANENFNITIRLPRNPKLKFGLKSLLLLLLVVAVGLGAHKMGQESGRETGYGSGFREGWAAAMSAKLVSENYSVFDLLEASGETIGGELAELDELLQEIQRDVDPASWKRNGGPAEINIYPQNLSLTVKQTARGHESLKSFLDRKRLIQRGEVE
ncbi:MAG: hypothetical protein F9B45_22120 [Phycisphaera sp. RhM]|nr:hypothetical protein [Phycisphaera sp. RhM]